MFPLIVSRPLSPLQALFNAQINPHVWRVANRPAFSATSLSETAFSETWKSTPEAYTVDLITPGAAAEDLDVRVHNRVLSISCGSDSGHLRTWRKAWRVPEDVDTAEIQAHVQRGILQLTLPRHANQSVRHIIVQEGRVVSPVAPAPSENKETPQTAGQSVATDPPPAST